MALTYAQFGLLASAHGRPAEALYYAVRACALFDDFPDRRSGTGPRDLALLTEALGEAALAATWQRATGQPLPDRVRHALPVLLETLRKAGLGPNRVEPGRSVHATEQRPDQS